MGKEYGTEKLFAEQLDKALAGQIVQVTAEMDADLRTALEFSQKIAALRPDPRLQFQSVLKANLLVKLNEKSQPHKAARAGFWKIIPREPVWQAVIVLAVIVIVGSVVWGTLSNTRPPQVASLPSTPPPATTAAPQSSAPLAAPGPVPTFTVTAPAATSAPARPPVPAPTTTSAPAAPAASAPATTAAAPTAASTNKYLAVDGSADKSIYQSGQPVNIQVSWKNLTAQNLTINEFPPLVSVMQTAEARPVYTFAAGKTSRTLSPGESAVFSFTWDQRDAQGNPVAAGNYRLELEELFYNGQSVKLNFTRPVTFDIR